MTLLMEDAIALVREFDERATLLTVDVVDCPTCDDTRKRCDFHGDAEERLRKAGARLLAELTDTPEEKITDDEVSEAIYG